MFLCQARGGFCVWLRRQGQWCHTAVQSLLGKESSHWVDKSVTIRGWVQSSQHHKRYLFFHVNDGSSLSNLQVVVSLHEDPQPSWANEVTPGSSVLVQGTLLKSNHSGQHVELAADSVELLGPCNTGEHLFKARGKLDPSYTRQFPHLRPRTRAFSSLLRLRDSAAAAVHEYLRGKGLVQVHTPIITPSDCEGAGDLFTVKPIEQPDEDSDEFFGCKAYLTVSGQLYAEAVACGMSNVYTFGPTFRAEHTHTRRHLSEFHMIEPEMVLSELGTLLEVMQGLFRASVEGMLREREEDLRLYHQESPLTEEWVMKSLSSPFQRMTYAEAVDVLNKADTSFRFTPKWGKDLQTEHEQYLTSHVGNLPLFVTDYPIALRPFYARLNDDGCTVSAVDLLVPGVGELAGGSLREERLDILENTLTRKGMLDSYQWYLDLRRYGTMPHGGFGLGFERLLQAVLGVKQIRDVVPFPRLLGSCKP